MLKTNKNLNDKPVKSHIIIAIFNNVIAYRKFSWYRAAQQTTLHIKFTFIKCSLEIISSEKLNHTGIQTRWQGPAANPVNLITHTHTHYNHTHRLRLTHKLWHTHFWCLPGPQGTHAHTGTYPGTASRLHGEALLVALSTQVTSRRKHTRRP